MALDGLLSGRDPQCLVIVARDEDGTAIAFQRYVPCKNGNGLSIDAMRRDPVGPNGVNERMIVDVVSWAQDHGISEVSLNFAVFKGLIEEGADLRFVAAAEAWLVRRLNPYFQIESLLTFSAKFGPRWVPRYLVYRSGRRPRRGRHRSCERRGLHAVRSQDRRPGRHVSVVPGHECLARNARVMQ